MPERTSAPIGDKQIIIESGKIAKQADGAVTVQLGETIVVVAAVGAAKAKPGQDFFPLTVDYREKAAAAGSSPVAISNGKAAPPKRKSLLRA
jgi:polyribonucleotide nucleotidyltransferase